MLLVSTYVFEAGTVSDEIDQVGYAVGAPELLLSYMGVSLLTFYLIWKLVPRRIRERDIVFHSPRFFYFLFAMALVFYAVPILQYGPAVMRGLNRYQFHALPNVAMFNIKLFMGIACSVLGLIIAGKTKTNRRIAWSLLGVLIILNLAYGEKASGMLMDFTFFASGLLIGFNRPIRVFAFLAPALAAGGLLVGMYFLQLGVAGATTDDISAHFANRFGRQSQLWWKTVELHKRGDLVSKARDVDMLLDYDDAKEDRNVSGMRYMMSVVMPAKRFAQHNGSLAGGYPAALFYIDGGENFFVFVIILAIVYIVPFYLIFVIFFESPALQYLIPLGIYFLTVHLKIFDSGNTYLVSNPKYMVGYAILLALAPVAIGWRLSRKAAGRSLPARASSLLARQL